MEIKKKTRERSCDLHGPSIITSRKDKNIVQEIKDRIWRRTLSLPGQERTDPPTIDQSGS